MNGTILVGIAAIALAAVFRVQSESFPDVAQRLPNLLIWIVAGLAVLMIGEEVLEQRRLSRITDEVQRDLPGAEEGEPAEAVRWKVVISFGITLIAYVALIPVLGYLITTVAFIAGVLLVSRAIRPLSAVLVSLGLTGFIWLVFIWALNLPVPLLPWLKA